MTRNASVSALRFFQELINPFHKVDELAEWQNPLLAAADKFLKDLVQRYPLL